MAQNIITNTNNMALHIKELSQKIRYYQEAYYNDQALISDNEFDALWDELKNIDPLNPLFHTVGVPVSSFSKMQHIMPMGSQEKASCPEEFLLWTNKHDYKEYLVEYKLDGASLELQYEAGILTHAVTRGDGNIGEDITQNALLMQGVLRNIASDFYGAVRGEVIMEKAIHRQYYNDKANCRNAANGLMRKKDGVGVNHLKLITYDAYSTINTQEYFTDEICKIDWLKMQGFFVVPLVICNSANSIIDYRACVMEMRPNLNYDIDGLVIKERAINLSDSRRDRPDRQIAFKFNLEEATTIIKDVIWNENGATYTPVAIFSPVNLNGTTVQRASLCNPNTIRSLNLQIGSHVVVVKRGEIIPKIQSVIKENDTKKHSIHFPTICNTCGYNLIDEGTRLYCPNLNCDKRILHQITKWVEVAGIMDLGQSLLNALFVSKQVRSIKDIYNLTTQTLKPYFLNQNSLCANKNSKGANNVIQSIKKHSVLSLASFVAGFDIENIGQTMIEKLVSAGFNTLEKLLAATENDIMKVSGFAQITAQTLIMGLKQNASQMYELLDTNKVNIKQDNTGNLTGLSFCFTGELHTLKRAKANELVINNGGSIKSNVTKDLSYLVTNDTTTGSTKNQKAAALGIKIITEEQFLTLLQKTKQIIS